ncbi:MAG: Mur ligase family protein, partial [Bryobacteraceae bacterium]
MRKGQSVMTLKQALSGVRLKAPGALPSPEAECLGLDYDSRRIQPGWIFFAFPGSKVDGRRFALQAVEKGALGVLSELPAPEGFPGFWIEVEHGREALATAAGNFYRWPDRRIDLTGVTGTNGKTTTAFLIDSLLHAAGKTTMLAGTIEYRLAGKILPAVNTTPESLDLFRLLSELESLGGTHGTLEVSSHALALGRVHSIRFHTAVFTNLTRDHLDFHRDMDDYFAAKQRLFTPDSSPAPECAVINWDDEYGRRIRRAANTTAIRYS